MTDFYTPPPTTTQNIYYSDEQQVPAQRRVPLPLPLAVTVSEWLTDWLTERVTDLLGTKEWQSSCSLSHEHKALILDVFQQGQKQKHPQQPPPRTLHFHSTVCCVPHPVNIPKYRSLPSNVKLLSLVLCSVYGSFGRIHRIGAGEQN